MLLFGLSALAQPRALGVVEEIEESVGFTAHAAAATNRSVERTKALPEVECQDCSRCPIMVTIPAGRFLMGSFESEPGRADNEGPQHIVTIGEAFAIGKYEVTKSQFESFLNETGHDVRRECYTVRDQQIALSPGRHFRDPSFKQADDDPAVCVNWLDATAS